MEKRFKQYIVFGEDATRRAVNGEWSALRQMFEDCPNCIGKRYFNTEEERTAYISGLYDAVGWLDTYPLSEEDVRRMSKRIRLSKIEDLSEV